LDASSDEEGDGDAAHGAPKLPRAVLQALLRGNRGPPARGDVPRMLLAGPLPPPPPPTPPLASFFSGSGGSSEEAMDVE